MHGNIDARSRNHCCRKGIKYSDWVPVALVFQHTKRMRLIIVSSVASLVLQYFSTLSHTRHNIREKVIKHKMFVLIFSTALSEIVIINGINQDKFKT
jgi:hypothetical protein